MKKLDPKQIKIEQARPDDATEVTVVRAHGWRDNNTDPENGVTIDYLERMRGYTIPPTKERVESTRNYITENPINNIIARVDDRVVGSIGLEFKDNDVISFGVYTHPDYRGKGVGSKLMNYVFDKYEGKAFEIEVAETNEKAIRLYEKLGFKVSGKSKWSMKDDDKNYLRLVIIKRDVRQIRT